MRPRDVPVAVLPTVGIRHVYTLYSQVQDVKFPLDHAYVLVKWADASARKWPKVE